MTGREFDLFSERKVRGFLQARMDELEKEVENASDESILDVGEEQYVQQLVANHRVQELVMDFDGVWTRRIEQAFPIKAHPERVQRRLRGSAQKKFKRLVVPFYIPFSGDPELLRCSPISRSINLLSARIEKEAVRIDYVAFERADEDPEKINGWKDSIVKSIKSVYENVRRNVEKSNGRLEQKAREVFQKRKKRVREQHDMMDALSVPVWEKSSPDTFSIPEPEVGKPIRVEHPQVQAKDSKPKPTLDGGTYRRILELLYSTGRMFGRSPVFAGMPEESLRDIFLAVLEPRFEGSATGETFNRSGKTDILLRHEGKNVFVAECKFWSGSKALSGTIDQLLGYLTWRDSKTALVVFVDRKDFTPILEKAQEAARAHDCFVKEHEAGDKAFYNFTFHLPDDPNREIKVALQLFHLPKPD